jgi:metallo-beta-lactamase family protein
MLKLQFIGATGTVTGSKYLLQTPSQSLMVDCGLFQGYKMLRLRNWAPLPFDPRKLGAVILTHAHVDHCGYLPLLVKHGYAGHIYCTSATRDLCTILLMDSAKLQEEEADHANKHGFSKHKPALPLYTRADAERCFPLFKVVDMDARIKLGDGLSMHLRPSGHILGSAFVTIHGGSTSITFSGDLGRQHDLVMRPPVAIEDSDYLVIESTYGNRLHDPTDPGKILANTINRTIQRGGVLVIPAFAVGRVQTLLYYIYLLKKEKSIPHDLPVYLNSPMAVNVTRIFIDHIGEHKVTTEECRAMCEGVKFVETEEESKRLNHRHGPMIIIAGSGMATGGRVVHHLKEFVPNPRNTILFSGFQAGGTRGALMVGGVDEIKIHGEYFPVRAEIVAMDNLSAHADANEIIAWLKHFNIPPIRTFVTHGEPAAADALRFRIQKELSWSAYVPDYLETVTLR